MGIRFGIRAFATALALGTVGASANETPQPLPFTQDWSDASLITVDDDWSNVPGITGFRGQRLAPIAGLDPRGITGISAVAPDGGVHANGGSSGDVGVIELVGTNPSIALQASPAASAPYLLMHLDTTGVEDIEVAYTLRDAGVSGFDAVQPVAVQYRVGAAGRFTDLPAGFVDDATGPVHAGVGTAPARVTRVAVALPPDADGQPLVQVRILASDAPAQDEPISIDDIEVDSLALRPDLSLAAIAIGEGDANTAINVVASLDKPAVRAPVTFTVSTIDGTATAGEGDYLAITDLPMVIPVGESSVTVPVSINGDMVFERDEAFTVRVADVVGARVVSRDAAISLANDDASALPVVRADGGTVPEGALGQPSPLTFVVSADRPVSSDVTFSYRTIADTAGTPAGTDYTPVTTGVGTIASGTMATLVNIDVIDDASVEATERFYLRVSSLSANATLGATSIDAIGTIIDNDVGLSWRPRAAAVEGASGTTTTLTFDITLSDPIDRDLAFTLFPAGGNATGGEAPPADYLQLNYPGVIAAGTTGTTIDVVVFGDDLDEGDQHFGSTVMESDPGVTTITPPGGAPVAVIIDDEGESIFRHGFE